MRIGNSNIGLKHPPFVIAETSFDDALGIKSRSNYGIGAKYRVLGDILSTITERCIIFLDAHGSGGDTVYDERYGRYGTPVLDELASIKNSSKLTNHIILIDDCDDLGTLKYPSRQQVENAILEINSDYYIELDIPKQLLMSRGTGIAYLPEG